MRTNWVMSDYRKVERALKKARQTRRVFEHGKSF